MSSNTLIECQDKVLEILLDMLRTDLSPAQSDQIMCKVQAELIRVYQLGLADASAAYEKERRDRKWAIDYWFNRQIGG